MHLAVHPLPAETQQHDVVRSKTTVARGPPRQSVEADTIYKDDAVKPLGSINVRRTLGGKLCGRVDDLAFNAKIIHFARRAEPFMTAVAVVFAPSTLSLFFIADVTARSIMSYVTAVSGAMVCFYIAVSLSWDMLCLVVGTFEFWFLFFINAANDVLWNVLFYDARMAGLIASGCNFAVSLTFDANIYTRRFVTRVLVFGSPALLVGLTVTALHIPPDVHYKTFKVLGVEIDSVDLLVNGNLIITYFTAIRVFRTQHLVFSKAPIRSIKCDMYHPVCQLVLHSQPLVAEEASDVTMVTARRLSILGQSSALQQLKLLHSSAAHGIDVTKVLWPGLAHFTQRITPLHFLNVLGFLSHATALYGSGGIVYSILMGERIDTRPPATVSVIVSFACALVVSIAYIANAQLQLVKRICWELDAWFVYFQVTVVTIGVCDLLQWGWHRVLPLFTSWLWCHWTIFLDAVPPPTRRRLGYSRLFARLTTLLLIAYPITLAYALYFVPELLRGRDRVIFQLNLGNVQWQIKLLGFLASKLFTLEVWMLRFFWRELLRPSDAFKLIKRRVFYHVPSA